MAKKTLPPIVLPVVDLTNVVDINAYRYARQRLVAEQPPEPTTPRGRKGSLLSVDPLSDVGS